MNAYDLIEIVLNQRAFSVIVVSSVVAAAWRPDLKTLALFFFVAGYFSTQIPLIEHAINISRLHRYVIQSLISVAMLLFYTTIPKNSFILFAAACELVLIGNNLAFAMGGYHPWYHWAIVSAINWASFISLSLNKWGRDRNARPIEQHPRTGRALDHVYGRRGNL